MIRHNRHSATIIVWSLILVHISFYIFKSIHLVKLHEKSIKDCYSDIDRINLKWLRFFIIVLHSMYALYFLLLVWLVHDTVFGGPFPYFQKIISVSLSVVLYCLGYRGLTQPGAFVFDAGENNGPDTGMCQSVTTVTKEPQTPKYVNSGLDEAEADEISRRLLDFMEEENPYLNPGLTLPELSEMLDIPRNRLSQVLNDNIGCNFYDFINGYRVREVQRLMADPANGHLKLLALAFDAGFNSKATFNTIFKKTVGMTPSEYRNTLPS